ncbi:MAG: beta-ketoacyl-ACP synthase III [Thiobacillus sp.]|nr:beta-ketoacyl-ACP synthase III [Thiobacillus sp.]
MTTDVFITRSAAHLPLAPVGNDEIESVLGRIGGKPSRVKRVILRSNGIESRHYALDRATGEPVMTHAQLTAAAIRGLGDTGPVDCLATGTSIPDQLLPGHGVMVHGELGWPQLEVVSMAGICLSGTAALKYAFMAVATGNAKQAVATGSELVSPLMHARNFEAECEHKAANLETHPEIAFEKDFLRWMLSDGAGALLLAARPGPQLSLRIRWIELFSNAHRLPTCMYAGGDKTPDGSVRGWMRFPVTDWASQSVFSIKQDVRLLNEQIAPATVIDPMRALRERHDLRADQIDWFLPHISSHYFQPILEQTLDSIDFHIPRARWFTNLATCGNTGSASPFIMLDALMRSGNIRAGQTLLLYVPESGRFSSGYICLEAV